MYILRIYNLSIKAVPGVSKIPFFKPTLNLDRNPNRITTKVCVIINCRVVMNLSSETVQVSPIAGLQRRSVCCAVNLKPEKRGCQQGVPLSGNALVERARERHTPRATAQLYNNSRTT